MFPIFEPPQELTESFLEQLCDELDVQGGDRTELKRGILRCAITWVAKRSAPAAHLSERERKGMLEEFSSATEMFAKQLRNTPDWAWTAMRDASAMLNSAPHEARIEFGADMVGNPSFEEEGEPRILLPNDAGEDLEIPLSCLLEALRNVSLWADVAANGNEKPKPGPQRNFPLEAWLLDMEGLWEARLGRKFTRDVTQDGTPISEAARLCAAVYKKMDPATPTSRVLNAMKKRISWRMEYLNRKK